MSRRDVGQELRVVGLPVVVAILVGIGAVMAAPAAGQDDDGRWRVRLEPMFMIAAGGDEAGLVATVPEFDETETGLDSNEQSIDHGPGIALALEYLMTRKLGVELSAMAGSFDASYFLEIDGVRETWSGDIDFSAFTLGLSYHFTPAKRADYFLGLFVSKFEYDDLTFGLPAHDATAMWTFVGEDGWGYRGGVDIDLGQDSPWFLAVGVRHFRGSFDVHPVMVSVGVGRNL